MSKRSEDKPYISSSEDEEWELETSPLINACSFGWTEDGRCGYESKAKMQLCPCPIPSFRLQDQDNPANKQRKFVYKAVACGSRHSLFVMIDSAKQNVQQGMAAVSRFDARKRRSMLVPKRPKKILLTGLNQMALCEDPALVQPTEIILPPDIGSLHTIACNNGASYFTTKYGVLYAFGNSKFGKLGFLPQSEDLDGENTTDANAVPFFLKPQIVPGLSKKKVSKIATMCSAHHVLALTEDNLVYSWGKNDKGQLGRGFESAFEAIPAPIQISRSTKGRVISLAVGAEHTTVLIEVTLRTLKKDAQSKKSFAFASSVSTSSSFQHLQERLSDAQSVTSLPSPAANKSVYGKQGIFQENDEDFDISYDTFVFSCGDGDRGQLGSGDLINRSNMQENVWLTKLTRKLKCQLSEVVCGGYFTMAVIKYSGQVIVWGANEYGQLGLGHQHDSPEPVLQHSLEKIFKLSAGLRHCICAAESSHSLADVYAWGFNNWGELGLGDTDIRLYPTKITALRHCKVLGLACGERHTVVVTSHKAMLAKHVPSLKPMFHLLSEEEAKYRKHLLKKLKVRIQRDGMLQPSVLDNPDAPLPNQPGSSTDAIPNDRFEKGLRYCMDTFKDELDWRRQSMEACFTVHISPKLTLKSVCLSCARRCLRHNRLVPYIRTRTLVSEGTALNCDCNLTGNCRCRWSPIREVFDSFAVKEVDECIGLHQLRSLIKRLRFPFPVEAADLDDANMTFTAQAYAKMHEQSSKVKKPVNRSMFKNVHKKKDIDEHSWASGSAIPQSTLPSSLEVNEGDRRHSKDDAPDLLVRIDAVAFERWYRIYFDEPETGSGAVAVSQKVTGKITEEEAQEEEYNNT